jgi:uncharacterized membrane protein
MTSSPVDSRSRTFFVRGLKTLLPTLITLYLVLWAWSFLWDQLGWRIIWLIQNVQYRTSSDPAAQKTIFQFWHADDGTFKWWVQPFGVSMAVLTVYLVGLLVGNLIGRTFMALGESLVMRLPVVRAIYPAVKQITDFLLQERTSSFQQSRVVACQPHASGIWSIGLITGTRFSQLEAAGGDEMISVFIPSTPTAFTGYVVIVPRSQVIDLPLTVEEAMRVLVSGGVLHPGSAGGGGAVAAAGGGGEKTIGILPPTSV